MHEFSTDKADVVDVDSRSVTEFFEKTRKIILDWPGSPSGLPAIVFVDGVEV